MSGGAKTHYGSQVGAGGALGFYGAEPVAKQTVNLSTTTTATTTALESTVSNLLQALKTLGLIDSNVGS